MWTFLLLLLFHDLTLLHSDVWSDSPLITTTQRQTAPVESTLFSFWSKKQKKKRKRQKKKDTLLLQQQQRPPEPVLTILYDFRVWLVLSGVYGPSDEWVCLVDSSGVCIIVGCVRSLWVNVCVCVCVRVRARARVRVRVRVCVCVWGGDEGCFCCCDIICIMD